MTDPDSQFAAVAAAGTFAIAVLLGLLGGLVHLGSGHSPLAFAASGTGAVVSYWLVTVGISILGALTVTFAGFAVARSGGSRWKRVLTALGAVVVVGFPALLLVAVFVFGLSNAPGGRYTISIVLVLLLPSLTVGAWLGRRYGNSLPWTRGFHAVLALALLSGLLVGGVAVGPGSSLTEQGTVGTPRVDFAGDYERASNGTGVLVVIHADGNVVPADQLRVVVEGAADVPNATQTESGPWGGATAQNDDDGERVVRPGDLVRVGVESDCRVRLIFERGESSAVLDELRCEVVRE